MIETVPKSAGRGVTYLLAEAGRDLSGVMTALGSWGERWVELGDEHTNPCVVLWAWCTAHLDRDLLPDRRVLVRFEFTDQPPGSRRLWMLAEHGDAELCKKPPGFAEDVVVETDTRTLARWHLREIEWADAVRAGRVKITGPRSLARALPTWNRRGC